MSRSGRFRGAAVAIVLGMALLASACGDGSSGEASGSGGDDGKLKIGVALDLSGQAAFAGLQDRIGMELAAEVIEDSGMLGDTELELVFVDTETDKDRAVSEVTRMTKDDSFDAIIGPLSSSQGLATAPISQQAEVPTVLIHNDAAHPDLFGDFIYRITPPAKWIIPSVIENFASRDIETIALVYDETNPTLVEVAEEIFPAAYEEHGIEVVYESTFQATDTDFSAMVTDIARANPDGVGLLAAGAPNVTILKQLRERGYDGPLFAQNAATVFKDAGADADGTIWATYFDSSSELSSVQDFIAAFEDANGEPPNQFNASGYDAVWLLALAYEAGGDGRDGIKKGLDEVTAEGFEGAQGALTFEDRDARVPPAVWQIRGGVEGPYTEE